MANAQAARPATADKEKGRVVATRVARYWPGRRPSWAGAPEEEGRPAVHAKSLAEVHGAVVLKEAADPRLLRLSGNRTSARQHDRSRPLGAAPEEGPLTTHEADAGFSAQGVLQGERGNEDDVAARRRAARLRLTVECSSEPALASEDEGSESECSSSNSDGVHPLVKPVFVPKSSRETILEREALEREEEIWIGQERERLGGRKLETLEIVQEQLRHDLAAEQNLPLAGARDDHAHLHTDSEEDADVAYEQWKMRELRRIGQDRLEREREVKAADERGRWKHMSEEERKRWQALDANSAHQNKKQWKFLQKYWHKGAFFQTPADTVPDDDNVVAAVLARSFDAPTGEDKFDKSLLPKVMQVKNFGRRGRTKWTHLLDEDTTRLPDGQSE